MNDIILGSGHVYVVEKTNSVKLTSSMDATAIAAFITAQAIPANLAGHIKGGATLNYSATRYTEQDDFVEITKTITTDEALNLAFGYIDWTTGLMDQLIDTAKTTTGTNEELVAIGGAKNSNGKSYVVIFAHEDAADFDTYVLLQGKNSADLAAAFANGAGTQFNAQFDAEPFDDGGRKCFIYRKKHTTQTVVADPADPANAEPES